MKDLNQYLAVALLLLGVFLYIQYNKPPAVSWSRTYARTDKIPYGTYILRQQLSPLFGGVDVAVHRKRIYNTLSARGDVADTYFIIAQDLDIDEPDYRALSDYVGDGHTVFIAAHTFGTVMADSLGLDLQFAFPLGDSVSTAWFINPQLDPQRAYRFGKRLQPNHFTRFDTTRASVLATNHQGNPLFLRYPIGQGRLFLLSAPDYLTNYALLTADGAAFAATALSYLEPRRQIIWDDYQTLGTLSQQSPMRVFLDNEYLRPAYLIALFSLLAFVLYGIKRRQRIVPVVEPLRNTSVAFAQVVSSVYYEQHDNRDILAKRYAHFMQHVRTQYRILGHEADEAFMAQLGARSGAGETTLQHILMGMQATRSGNVIDDDTLLSHNRHLETFYQQTSWKNNPSNSVQT